MSSSLPLPSALISLLLLTNTDLFTHHDHFSPKTRNDRNYSALWTPRDGRQGLNVAVGRRVALPKRPEPGNRGNQARIRWVPQHQLTRKPSEQEQ